MKRFWQGLVIVLAIAATVITIWWRIDVWRFKNDKDRASAKFERLSDYAVTREAEYKDEIRIKDAYVGSLESDLEDKMAELDTAAKVVATYKGMLSKGQAEPDQEIPPDMVRITFRVNDPVFVGWFDTYGEYELQQKPMEFTLNLFRDENGKWAAVIDVAKLAEQYGITEEEAADLFRVENLVVFEKDPSLKWYENLMVGAAVGYTDTLAGKATAGYDIWHLDIEADLDGEHAVFFGVQIRPFRQ